MTTPVPATLPLTGERTVPGIPEENYWFRRHEIAYRFIADSCSGKEVLEAGSGEGYGGAMLAAAGATVTCVDYDASAVEHTRRRYPELTMIAGNLVDLPLPDESVDVVVNFQVIEHLWDQAAFIAECRRVLRPGGRVVLVGMGADSMELPVSLIQNRELVLTGVFRYANTWPTALALVRTGAVDLDSMVTARFGLDELPAALNADRITGHIKAVVYPALSRYTEPRPDTRKAHP